MTERLTASSVPVRASGEPQKDILEPIKAVLTEITIWRGVNWNHAGADVCGEIEKKLIAALRKVRKTLAASPSDDGAAREPQKDMRLGLRKYLDRLIITGDNIGDVRRGLFVPWDSEWNGWVRDETAKREVPSSPAGR